MGSIWKEIGDVADGGDIGGDWQATASWSRRFHAPTAARDGEHPVVTIYAYGIADRDDGVSPPFRVETQYELTLCADPRRPGDTERWSDSVTVTGADTYDRLSGVAGAASAHLCGLGPEAIHWDGLTIDGSYRGNGWGELAP